MQKNSKCGSMKKNFEQYMAYVIFGVYKKFRIGVCFCGTIGAGGKISCNAAQGWLKYKGQKNFTKIGMEKNFDL